MRRLTSLKVGNFKCFRDASFEFGALTLLAGINGAGKSTLIQSLLLLRQSYNQGLLQQEQLALNGDLVSLGSGQDVLFEDADPEIISFECAWQDGEAVQWSWQYDASHRILKAVTAVQVPATLEERAPFMPRFSYLSAERVSPATFFPMSVPAVEGRRHLGNHGEFTAHYLAQYRDDPVICPSLHRPEEPDQLLRQVEAWMNVIRPGLRLDAKDHAFMDVVELAYQFRVGKLFSGRFRSTNVGFGLTYILPVIVAILAAEFFALEFAPDYPLRRWLNDEAVDRDVRRRLTAYASGRSYLTREDPPEILERWHQVAAFCGQRRAFGLFAAFLLDSVAVSLALAPRWQHALIELQVQPGLSEQPYPETIKVRHAADESDWGEHETWLKQRDGDRAWFRSRVEPVRCHHVSASEYRKHVHGASNEERRKRALRTRQAQFVAVLDGRKVTDETIRTWETEALVAAWQGESEVLLQRRGEQESSFFVYVERDHVVGYEAGTGHEIQGLRVEWTSQQVHSHPKAFPTRDR